METRRFGRTELQMPVLSCGGMRFQQSWRDSGQPIEPARQAEVEACLAAAADHGITHIETARGYGTSERQLGMVFERTGAEGLIVQTKVAPRSDPARFEADVRDSLRRLRLPGVDLLALHGVNSYEKLWWSMRPGGCLEVAERLRDEGLVGGVGFSTHASPELIIDAIESDRFDYVNLHWYYIRQTNEPALAAAAAHDLGVFIISPSDKGGQLYQPPARLVELCGDVHPLVFNTRFGLQRPEVHTLSVGAARPSDFELAVSAVSVAGVAADAEAAEVAAIDARLRAAMDAAIGEGVYPRLGEGLPNWWDVPGMINIEFVLWLRAIALGWGLLDFARWRYASLGRDGDWVPGMGAGDADAYDLRRAVAGSPFADEIPGWLTDAHRLLAG